MEGRFFVLVLNRRPGESILVEDDIDISVLRGGNESMWLRIASPKIAPSVLLGATAVSTSELRLEIGAPRKAWIDEEGVHVEVAEGAHPAVAGHATISFFCRPGQIAKVGAGLELGVGPTERGHTCLTLDGPAIGVQIRLALIRLSKSCVRLGVDAPGRRVYRKELWEALVAANTAAAGTGDDLSDLQRRGIRSPAMVDARLPAAV